MTAVVEELTSLREAAPNWSFNTKLSVLKHIHSRNIYMLHLYIYAYICNKNKQVKNAKNLRGPERGMGGIGEKKIRRKNYIIIIN